QRNPTPIILHKILDGTIYLLIRLIYTIFFVKIQIVKNVIKGWFLMKKVWVSAILSFIFPGLGHLYLGRVLKGLFFVIVNIVSILFTGNILGILVFLLNWIFSILDSIKTTKVINSINSTV
ncbi:DUF6677 family protein, partial [Geobacillus stearothermophilus]